MVRLKLSQDLENKLYARLFDPEPELDTCGFYFRDCLPENRKCPALSKAFSTLSKLQRYTTTLSTDFWGLLLCTGATVCNLPSWLLLRHTNGFIISGHRYATTCPICPGQAFACGKKLSGQEQRRRKSPFWLAN